MDRGWSWHNGRHIKNPSPSSPMRAVFSFCTKAVLTRGVLSRLSDCQTALSVLSPWEANDRFLSKSDRPPCLGFSSLQCCCLHYFASRSPHRCVSRQSISKQTAFSTFFVLIRAFLHFYISGPDPTRITSQNHDGGNAHTSTGDDITKDDVISRFATS